MSAGDPYRILVLSSRPDILTAVSEAAGGLEPRPEVHGRCGHGFSPQRTDLILVDIAEPQATISKLRRRFGDDPALVALIEGTWVDRLGSALAGDWTDYLFYPLNPDEVGLIWRRHTSVGEAPDLSLDVDESGRIQAVIPSNVRYQRPVVERVVVACRHLADLDADTAFRLRVALGEAVANAILYGGMGRPGDVVRIQAWTDGDRLRVDVADDGTGFDPASVPDPTSEDGIGRGRGRGLFLLRRLADEVRFNAAGNRVSLIFRRSLDPLHNLEPWLARFADVTGLRFRLDRVLDDESEVLFDGLGGEHDDAPADGTRETWPLGPEGMLKLVVDAGLGQPSGRDSAVELLEGLLGALAVSEDARERVLDRRMRRARVLAELEIARDLQLRLLPDPGDFQDLARVAARCDPALSLGGDFYYLARLSGGRLGVMLGDVSSHGPSAALIMALTLSAVALVTGAETDPAAALLAMQGHLLAALESTEMYMTLFYGVLDPTGPVLRYANAGHPYAYRLGGDGIERLEALGPPIGMGAAPSFGERGVRWSDETLLSFTDGLAELGDPLADADSEVRALLERGQREPRALVDALFADTDDDMRLDDRTAVAVRI